MKRQKLQRTDTIARPPASMPRRTTLSAAQIRTRLEIMLSGLRSSVPRDAKMGTLTAPRSVDEVEAALSTALALYANAESLAASLRSARAKLSDLASSHVELIEDLEPRVRSILGSESPKLGAFGLEKKKPRKLTTVEYARRAAKALATRKLRGTLGPKAKKKLRA